MHPAEVEPHLHVARIELEGGAVGRERTRAVPDFERDVALELAEVGALGSASLGLPQRGERPSGVARRGAAARHCDQRLNVVGRQREQLFGEPARLLHPAEPE